MSQDSTTFSEMTDEEAKKYLDCLAVLRDLYTKIENNIANVYKEIRIHNGSCTCNLKGKSESSTSDKSEQANNTSKESLWKSE